LHSGLVIVIVYPAWLAFYHCSHCTPLSMNKSQPYWIKDQIFLMTAPLYKNKKSAILDKRSTIHNDYTTVQGQKVSHGVYKINHF